MRLDRCCCSERSYTVGFEASLKRVTLIVLAAALAVSACATARRPAAQAAPARPAGPEARSYLVSENASADVDAALARARSSGKRVLLVMGANWCSDSRALAGWLGTERFAALIARKYELVFVNIGQPRTGDGHNFHIARRFGLAELPGLPNFLVLTADGQLVNPTTATTWRDAESRTGDAIYAELERLADQPVGQEVRAEPDATRPR